MKGRLLSVAEMVPRSKCIVDVGTDHGRLPVWLVKSGIAERAIVTDISAASLKKAEALIKTHGLENIIEPRVGDGLSVIHPGEADTVVMSGMGGLLIRDILESAPQVTASVKTFVLQPMRSQSLLRKWLADNGYAIVDESLVREKDKFYEVIVARHGRQHIPKDVYYDIGYVLIKKHDPLLKEFIEHKMAKTAAIIEQLESQGTAECQKELDEFKRKLEDYREVYQWVTRYDRS
ncbi:class I SAM-dependent methyltransferase [Caldicoprobacter algeriensis]|uniref:tRNA (adenine(22)-N(1))-methyltransferase n=1 Tax=Caldicoprobacter algeriensis TaxID=699281 RepID=UPI00207AD648|nr:class I SAM-dependent methyltransferase [Caldicoprobacter algeriensis]MCM8899812.1 class I SAM-dependent methyltransferase [Caldicoprobacter algeriensis]